MKKSLIVLASLGGLTGIAAAQSSVTVFGVIDESLNVQYSGGQRLVSVEPSQLSSNRLGFRGVEDMGGGLSAGFWLEAAVNASNGTVGGGNGQGTAFFNRRSTVSLISDRFGELRIGRDYTPTALNLIFDDVFQANGLGEGVNLASGSLGSGNVTFFRSNNGVTYILPSNLGGVYGEVQVTSNNGPATATYANRYEGGRLGWTGSGFDVNAGYGQTKTAFASDYKMTNAGASYDFGVAKVLGLWSRSQFSPAQLTTEELSFSVPFGLSKVAGSWTHAYYGGSLNGLANQLSAQYVYQFSKRTALYAGLAHTSNKEGADFGFGGTLDSPLAVAANGSINAYNVGVRHAF